MLKNQIRVCVWNEKTKFLSFTSLTITMDVVPASLSNCSTGFQSLAFSNFQ